MRKTPRRGRSSSTSPPATIRTRATRSCPWHRSTSPTTAGANGYRAVRTATKGAARKASGSLPRSCARTRVSTTSASAGGNTLNCDQALPWYNYLKDQLDEGNTHQLAGSFDNFAQFFTTVREDGKHATADEMHNVMEAMVGLEYGLQTGVWWGSAEYTRGEFCKASHGERLAYAEHRPNWTAASVYRAPDGRVQAFAGMSERQGVTTTYRFVSEERDVFFNGHGPQREYVVELPGGEPGSYQNGQTSAECVVNITWGDDIQPVVDGTYMLLNKDSRRLLDVANGSPSASSYSTGKRSLQWQVKPVDASIGGDFSYHQIVSGYSFQTLDVLNWSMNADTEIILYTNNRGSNQQWVLEYAGDGWFRIRSRHSALYLCFSGNKLIQTERDEASDAQLWRFVPTGIRPAVRDVDAPTGLTAEGARLVRRPDVERRGCLPSHLHGATLRNARQRV